MDTSPKKPRTKWPGAIAIYLLFIAVVVRTLGSTDIRDNLPWYLGLGLAYIFLYSVVLWLPGIRPGLLHVYFVVQSAIILALLSLNPELDFLSLLFLLLCAQAALVFPSRTCWFWVCILILLTGGSLMFYLGALRGLSLGLTTMAGCIIIPAYIIANQEIEMAQLKSQAMLSELQVTHQQLQAYAGQVEELAAIEERNRLARELHDSISQTIFSIVLNTRSAQILVQRDPARVRLQLEQLQSLAQDALAEMRGLIAQLRPSQKS